MSAANTAVLIEMLVGAVDSGGRATNLILGGAVDHHPPSMDTVGELPGVWTTPSGMDNVGGGCNARLWPRFFDEFCCCYC